MISQIFVLRCVMPKLWKLDTNGCHRTIDCSPSVWILQTRRTACLRIYERFTETLVSQWHLTPNNLVVWKRFIGPLMSFVHEGCILFHRLCPELPGVRMLSEPVYLSWRGWACVNGISVVWVEATNSRPAIDRWLIVIRLWNHPQFDAPSLQKARCKSHMATVPDGVQSSRYYLSSELFGVQRLLLHVVCYSVNPNFRQG